MARAIAHVVSSYREDDAHASNDAGLMILAVRKDTAAALAGTDGDFIPLIVDASGRLHVVATGAGGGGAVDTELPAAATLASAGQANQPSPQVVAQVAGINGTTIFPIQTNAGSVDISNSASSFGLLVDSREYRFNPVTGVWEKLRHSNTFKTVALGAGTAETTIWTPAAGKKFRLMGFILTAGAASTLTFKDNTAGTTIFIARGTTDQPITCPPLGNGILSAAANNVLTVTRGTSATLDGVVFGTEE